MQISIYRLINCFILNIERRGFSMGVKGVKGVIARKFAWS